MGPKRFEMPRISRTIRLDPVEVLGVTVEHLLLVRAARALRRQDHSVGVDLPQVGAEENVDGPVRPEHDAVWAESFDAVHDPGPDAFDRPIVVDHAETGNLAGHVGSLGERRDLTLPKGVVLRGLFEGETGVAMADLHVRVRTRCVALRAALARV